MLRLNLLKYILPIAAFILCFSCSRQTRFPSGEFGDAQHGIRVALSCPVTTVTRGESIPVYIVLQNTSASPVEMPRSAYVTVNLNVNGTPAGDNIGDIKLSKGTTTLMPEEQRIHLIDSFRSDHQSGSYEFVGHIMLFGEGKGSIPTGKIGVIVK